MNQIPKEGETCGDCPMLIYTVANWCRCKLYDSDFRQDDKRLQECLSERPMVISRARVEKRIDELETCIKKAMKKLPVIGTVGLNDWFEEIRILKWVLKEGGTTAPPETRIHKQNNESQG